VNQMRVLVVGSTGQVARALESTQLRPGETLTCAGRPHLNLQEPRTIAGVLEETAPSIIINAAAYTDVEGAESALAEAMSVNAAGAGLLAAEAAKIGAPVLHLSTDYVFDGEAARPYIETDAARPINAYGRSKLAGEAAVSTANPRHVILRTAWIHGPHGRNFVRTVLRLARERDEIRIVDDQFGNPTAAVDIAAALLTLARRFAAGPVTDDACGLFHMAAPDAASWAEYAAHIIDISASLGGPSASVKPIGSRDYPQIARRPANSRLDCSRIEAVHGVALPSWKAGVSASVERILAGEGGSN